MHTHLKETTGPTSLKISVNCSSVCSYGILPTNRVEQAETKVIRNLINKADLLSLFSSIVLAFLRSRVLPLAVSIVALPKTTLELMFMAGWCFGKEMVLRAAPSKGP